MKRLYGVLAIGVAAILLPLSISIAQTTNAANTSIALDQMQSYIFVEFFSCNMRYGIALNNFDMFGDNSPKTKKAFKEFGACQEKAALDAEARFAALKEQLAANEAAKTALKELYIYWRTEMSPGYTRKNRKIVEDKFTSLLERTRVEASW